MALAINLVFCLFVPVISGAPSLVESGVIFMWDDQHPLLLSGDLRRP